MKKSFTLLLLCAFSFVINAQKSITVIQSKGNNAFYAVGMSPDGEYLTGQVDRQHHMFVWKKGSAEAIESDEYRLNDTQSGSNAHGVSPGGKVAGICPNPDYEFAGSDFYGAANMTTAALFDYETKKWTFLPVVTNPGYQLYPDYGSRAYAISDDGKIVVGAQNPGLESLRWIAGYWKETTAGNFSYFPLAEDISPSRGSVAKSISGDGTVIGGFTSKEQYSYVPQVALWVDKNKNGAYSKVAIPGVDAGCVEGISNNGRYAVLTLLIAETSKAYLFDLTTNELTDINPQSAAALAVSDSGIVVGHWGGLYYEGMLSPYNLSYNIRHIDNALAGDGAFIYTKDMGVKALKVFFDENNITYPTGFVFKAATAISKAGDVICGYGILNGKAVSFRTEIPPINEKGIFSVTNFMIESSAYGSIKLSWETVPENDKFIGYKIYQQNKDKAVLLDTVKNGTTYTVSNLPDGTYSYYVVSSYQSKDADKTKTLSYTMGKKSLPLYEEFNYSSTEQLSEAYWDISHNAVDIAENSWYFDPGSGIPPGCMKSLPPKGGAYSESLTSPYYNAAGVNNLSVSFTIASIPAIQDQKIAIEVFVGNTWIMIDDLAAPGSNWTRKTYDLLKTSAAAAVGSDNIRIRFRCHGIGNSVDLNWFLDNVELSGDSFSEEPPMAVSAYYESEEKQVHINWADPHGFAQLRYMDLDDDDELLSAVGNAGKQFIGANLYMPEDLKLYKDYKLTSLSFRRGTSPHVISVEPEFKWFVSQGGEPIFNDAITNVQIAGTWTTVQLENPVAIDVTKPLYYGVEVTKHDVEDWPLGVGWMFTEAFDFEKDGYYLKEVGTAKGRGNLYSEDGGISWSELPEEIVDHETIPAALFCMRATLAKDPSAQPKDRIMGYRILRNGINLKGEGYLSNLNHYIDTIPLIGKEACYEILAFYKTLNAIAGEKDCIMINGIELTNGDNGEVKVYPNAIKKGETITVSVSNVSVSTIVIYELSGKKVKEIKMQGQSTPVQLDVEPGIYLLKVGDKETVKLIVK